MSSEKNKYMTALGAGLRTGTYGLFLILALLLLSALLIEKDLFPSEKEMLIIPLTSFLSGFFVRKLLNGEREGGALPTALCSAAALMLYLMIISAGVRDIHMNLKGIGTTAAVYALGDLSGFLVRINKKSRRKHHQR